MGVFAALLLLAHAPMAWAQGPTVSVSPTSGDTGAPLTVTGSGWTAGDTVTVDIGGAQVCQLLADVTGSINSIPVNNCQVPPGLASGSEPLTAQDPTAGASATGTPFTVTPFASFTAPASVAYGSPVSVDATQSQGTITKYLWDFGDGSTSSTTTPTTNHTYSKVGSYVITLTVLDASGNSDSVGQTVSVTGSAPTASFSPPATQPTGTTLNFDGTGSTTPNAGATVTSYDWNWGDGTPDGTGPTPTHSYTAAGNYTVTLTVSDSAGETSAPVSHTVTVDDRPPVASFAAPSSQAVGTPASFDGSGSSDPDGTIVAYDWQWGDGTPDGSGPSPGHTFSKVGTFPVTLTVTDNSGSTNSVTHSISVTGSAPTASFSSPPASEIGTTLNFDGTGSTTPNAGATITGYDWNWGDGKPDGSGPQPTHSYATAGSYTVTLTVTDSAGEDAVTSHQVSIQGPLSASFNAPGPQTVGTVVNFDGRPSSDPNGTIVSYDWNWGDGPPDGSGAQSSHTYTTVGTYDVTLTVTDNLGNTSAVTHNLVVTGTGPTAAFTAPSPAPLNAALRFDGRGSSTSNSCGTIRSYDWSWGDGTPDGSGAQPSHTFTSSGTFPVTLTVTDCAGQTSAVIHPVSIEGPPSASFTPTSTTVPIGTLVNFDGTASTDPNGTIQHYHWDFGDGATSSQPTPSHAYKTAQTYTVTLTVTDAVGASNVATGTVTVTPGTPVAAFNPTSATVLAGSPVSFDGTLSSDPNGPITSIWWTFGDGGVSSNAQPTHTYMRVGTFNVTLSVTDAYGESSTVTHQITVIAPPPIQTLILTPMASPTIVKSSSRVSATHGGIVDLGVRMFCPGQGSSCTAYVLATSKSLLHAVHVARVHRRAVVGSTAITIAPDGSAEATFRLSKRALKLLHAKHRLPVRVQITVVRGNQTISRTLTLTFVAS